MSTEHEILKLWVRPEKSGPMIERPSLSLLAGEGVRGDHTQGKKRHVTLLFADDWAAAEREVKGTVDPSTRRANVFLTGGGARHLVGSEIDLGEVRIRVEGVTAPCKRMEAAVPGLESALAPDGRGGVWGVVVRGGEIRPGDGLTTADR